MFTSRLAERARDVVQRIVEKNREGFEEILNAARAAGLTGSPSETGTPGHAALYYLALNDPIMSAAMQSARESLSGFLALARHPGPSIERFAVKIALLGEGGPEFFWIYPFANVGDRFIGQIGNTPLRLAGPKKATPSPSANVTLSTGCTWTPA